MVRRSPGRFLAPLALVAAAVALVLVIGGSSSSPSSSDTTSSTATTPHRIKAKQRPATTPSASGPRTYRVQSGDTLASIAQKTGVNIAVLRRLNPDVEPTALTVGQVLKLRS